MFTRPHMLRKLISLLTLIVFFCTYSSATAVALERWQKPKPGTKEDFGPQGLVAAESAILIEVTTGRILYQKQAYKARAQASTTKITTGILALEQGQLNAKVKASKMAADTGESGIWLEEGEELTLGQLLEALLLYSANDAAVAIAEHVGGSYDAFIEMMNTKAKEIGCLNTHYVNPHGLDADGHYSTAYDLALLARYGITAVPGFKELISKEEATIPWPGHEWQRVLHNRNLLIGKFEGADGVKTGFTNKAGRCVVASATRGEERYIAVVLDSPDRFAEAKKLLDYGFKVCDLKTVVDSGSVGTVKVRDGYQDSVEAVINSSAKVALVQQERLAIDKQFKNQLVAPVEMGQVLGYYRAFIKGKEVAKVPIVASSAVKRKSDWELFWDRVVSWVRNIF